MGEKKADELHWRETYFIVFPEHERPTLDAVEHMLGDASKRFQLKNLSADDQGLFQSVLVESDDDHAAVEVSFEIGEAVVEQNLEFAKQMQDHVPADQLQQLMLADARLEVAHFERCAAEATSQPVSERKSTRRSLDLNEAFSDSAYADDSGDDFDSDLGDPEFEMLDPTCLLTVVDALAALTDGLTIDPAAGELV
ncbi:hypothetical protein [Adhaeretor mobilis]|uniref:Uncharacterized protein n=1 Tax=Adhaeretor mobilis TaxID=1930276 RepID=A0A517MZ26_9BACT|nr:hypothetical protein [Adhaeretor mobilis]QDT00139.1 hypothetical protein HG15A2_34740 [Adhaeretor mobilis]